MKSISYIIGYRHTCDEDRRLSNLKLTIEWLINLKTKLKPLINITIIIIEQDSVPKFNVEQSIFNEIEYLFVYNPGFYNRGWGFNVGYKMYESNYYFFADGDILLNEKNMLHVFKTCFKYDAVNPYKHIYDSNEEYVLENKENLSNFNVFPERTDTCFSGGIIGISDESMNIVNGWDERFRGRGWEDYAFTAKIELFLYSKYTYPYSALHLWHPWETNTTRTINEALNLEYTNYVFNDYLNLIITYIKFGSPVKYARLTNVVKKETDKKNISHDRYYYAKDFFDNLSKRYKNKVNVNKFIYLHLCDQLKQDHQQIKESGGSPCYSSSESNSSDDEYNLRLY